MWGEIARRRDRPVRCLEPAEKPVRTAPCIPLLAHGRWEPRAMPTLRQCTTPESRHAMRVLSQRRPERYRMTRCRAGAEEGPDREAARAVARDRTRRRARPRRRLPAGPRRDSPRSGRRRDRSASSFARGLNMRRSRSRDTRHDAPQTSIDSKRARNSGGQVHQLGVAVRLHAHRVMRIASQHVDSRVLVDNEINPGLMPLGERRLGKELAGRTKRAVVAAARWFRAGDRRTFRRAFAPAAGIRA